MLMIDEVFVNDVTLLLIGSVITLIGAILLYFLQQMILRYVQRRGEISLYYKHVHNKVNGLPASIREGGTLLTIPLWLELHNNKEVNQVVRNINVALYNSERMVDKAIQTNYMTKGEEKMYLGNNGSYSFNLPSESIQQFEVYYLFKKSDVNKKFDSVYITYYTSKDEMIQSKILDLKDGWNTKKLNLKNDWIKSKS